MLNSLDYKTLFENTGVGIATIEADSTISMANSRLLEMLEVDEEEFIGSFFLQWIYGADRVMVKNYHTKRLQGKTNVPQNYKVRLQKKRGVLWALINITFLSSSGVTITSVLDITKTEQKLQETINAQDAILAAIPDLMFELDRNGIYLNVWTQRPQELAASKKELLGKSIGDFLPADATKELLLIIEETYKKGTSFGHQIQINTANEKRWFELSASLKENGDKEDTIIMLSRNITDRKELESKLLHLSRHDPLTTLYNRRTLQERLEKDIHRADRYHTPLSLCMLDIDYFKKINDRCGHLTGDQVLREFSALIQSNLRDMDYSGRYGGEEFVIALPDTTLPHACAFAERLRKQIAALKFYNETTKAFAITASIGVTEFSHENDSMHKMLKSADTAMYLAKNSGRNCVKS